MKHVENYLVHSCEGKRLMQHLNSWNIEAQNISASRCLKFKILKFIIKQTKNVSKKYK